MVPNIVSPSTPVISIEPVVVVPEIASPAAIFRGVDSEPIELPAVRFTVPEA